MDEIVKAALQKWPNVPHCYAWLALDARGAWRMRDERTQALNLPGDKIRNATLVGFINRNYQHDEQGRWYFQNGPQRVYVDLEATPYIAHTTPEHGFVLHTGVEMNDIDNVFLSADGKLFLLAREILAQVDDRDLAACLDKLQIRGEPVSDQNLMAWIENVDGPPSIQLTLSKENTLKVQQAQLSQLMTQFGYISTPRTNTAD
jgi:hypothetical protein